MAADDLRAGLERVVLKWSCPPLENRGNTLVLRDLRALLDAHPTPSEPEATVVEEWGVRWANGETTTEGRRRDWAADEINRVAHNAKSTGWRFYRDRHPGVLLRRTRTTYADRVTEWEEVE